LYDKESLLCSARVVTGVGDYRKKADLQAQVALAEKALATLRAAHSDAEAGIWKCKKKGEQVRSSCPNTTVTSALGISIP
jgi:hypothetical protein